MEKARKSEAARDSLLSSIVPFSTAHIQHLVKTLTGLRIWARDWLLLNIAAGKVIDFLYSWISVKMVSLFLSLFICSSCPFFLHSISSSFLRSGQSRFLYIFQACGRKKGVFCIFGQIWHEKSHVFFQANFHSFQHMSRLMKGLFSTFFLNFSDMSNV